MRKDKVVINDGLLMGLFFFIGQTGLVIVFGALAGSSQTGQHFVLLARVVKPFRQQPDRFVTLTSCTFRICLKASQGSGQGTVISFG